MAKEFIERAPVMLQIAGVKIHLKGDSDWISGYRDALQAVGELVQTYPAADVVEVVRCRDCKHGTLCLNMAGADYVDCKLDDYSTRLPHDFCSYGERRDNNA